MKSFYYIPNFSAVLPCRVQKWNEHQQPGSAESKDGRGKGWWEGISSQMEVALPLLQLIQNKLET